MAQRLVKQVRAYQTRDGALGEHMADQWLLPLALAVLDSGRAAAFTCTALTPHAQSNMAVIEAFLPLRFGVEKWGAGWRVDCAPPP